MAARRVPEWQSCGTARARCVRARAREIATDSQKQLEGVSVDERAEHVAPGAPGPGAAAPPPDAEPQKKTWVARARLQVILRAATQPWRETVPKSLLLPGQPVHSLLPASTKQAALGFHYVSQVST